MLAVEHLELRHRQPRVPQQALHDVFVHADRRPQDARAHEGHVGELEQTLDGAILAHGAMQDGEHHVYALIETTGVQIREPATALGHQGHAGAIGFVELDEFGVGAV